MARRKKKPPPRRTAQVVECRICGAKIVWLPETEDYCARRDGPCNVEPVGIDRWVRADEADTHGFTLMGMRLDGKRVDTADQATTYVVIFTRHYCAPEDIEEHRARAAAAAEPVPEESWGAGRAVAD